MDIFLEPYISFSGRWDFSPSFCRLNSIINIGIWMEHLIMFALLKVFVTTHLIIISLLTLLSCFWTMKRVSLIFLLLIIILHLINIITILHLLNFMIVRWTKCSRLPFRMVATQFWARNACL